MSKSSEKAYLDNIGEEGQKHALNKPYSDSRCGNLLIDIGTIITLLPPPPGRILDLGVGTGWTSVFFAQRGYIVTGQDIAENMIAYAELNKQRAKIDSLTFIASDYENLPFSNEFDYAIFYDSLHHSVNLKEALKAVYRALKPNGYLICVEPGWRHSKSKISLQAIKKWGVTERDMHPSLIIKTGMNIGFSKAKVFLRLGNYPIEIMQHLSAKGFLNACKTFLRFLPGIGMLTSNITMLIK